jgi:hypothetical protein
LIDKQNVWKKIAITIKNSKNFELINIIIKNIKIDNIVIIPLLSNKEIKTEIKETNLFYLLQNNNITKKLIMKLFSKQEILNTIKILLNNTILNKNIILKQYFINFYIENIETYNIEELKYILNNYTLEQFQINKIYRYNYHKLFESIKNDNVNFNKFFKTFENFENKEVTSFFKKEEHLFYYFLSQKKNNEKLKNMFIKEYIFNLKKFIIFSIKNDKYIYLKVYLSKLKELEIEDINEIEKNVNTFLKISEEKSINNNLILFKINKIKTLFEQYLFLNKEYQDDNDFDYYLENNIKYIDFYSEINIDMFFELLETFIYEEEIDKIIFVLKIILKKGIEKDKRTEFKNILTHEFFYDHQEQIIVEFRNIFIEIFNSIEFDLNYNIDEEYRLGNNIKFLYEKIYYKDINYKNLKYVLRTLKKQDLFSFLYNNNLLEVFFRSKEINIISFEETTQFIIEYINKIKTERIELNEEERNFLKYNLIYLMINNPYIDKNYHFKFYKYYNYNLFLKKGLLENKNLSFIVLYKSLSNIEELKYLINNNSLFEEFQF